VSATLRQASSLPGVFSLGEANGNMRAEIDGLTGPSGSIALAKKTIAKLSGSLDKKQQKIAAAREELKEAAWSKRSEVPTNLQEMFTGYGGSKEKFLKRLLDVATSRAAAEKTFDTLEAEATAVLAQDAVELEELPRGREFDLEDTPGFRLLNVPIVGSSDVRLTQLIDELQNADWVEHGRHYLNSPADVCPFCQQTVPEDLVEQLDAYFDTRYTNQIEQLKGFRRQAQIWVDGWQTFLDTALSRAGATDHLATERFQAARLELEQVLTQLMRSIDAKLSGPSAAVSLVDPASHVETINAILDEANVSIRDFNSRLRNRATAREALLDQCWASFARQTLATEVGRLEGAMPSLIRGRDSLQEKVDTEEDILQQLEFRLRELQTKVTSSKPIIATINGLLDSVGFHSFRLQESAAMKDGYSLVRENGEVAADTLSEGEQTFITFLYFAQSLEGTPHDSSDFNDLVAVIDDPISSLDSDVLYAVSTLTRRLVADIGTGNGRVRQLIVLTHNAHFHKEVTYKAQGDSDAGWQYGVVRKQSGQPSKIVLGRKNPIQTAYAALWEEVKRSSEDSSTSVASLQNILRRILETYFKILGGMDNSTIIDKFVGVEKVICRSLFSWVNAGSHSIFDDIEYSPSATTVESHLRVFRRIFEEQNQEGHYLMMMGITADASATVDRATGEQRTKADAVNENSDSLEIVADKLASLVA
jgi:wobble nucleotide-excising tRNase